MRSAVDRTFKQPLDYALIGPVDSRIHEFRTARFPFNTVCYIGRDFGNKRWAGCSGILMLLVLFSQQHIACSVTDAVDHQNVLKLLQDVRIGTRHRMVRKFPGNSMFLENIH